MTFAFAMLVAGAVALLSGVRNRSVSEVLRGITSPQPGPGEGISLRNGIEGIAGISTANISAIVGTVDPGVTTFDGKPVCAWMKPILIEARRRGWKGTVNSGYRSLEEQTRIWNDPSITVKAEPGTSNHEGCAGTRGAVDVSDHENFARIMKQMGNPIHNALGPDDPWHFSKTGR